jgi:hypothetical protein
MVQGGEREVEDEFVTIRVARVSYDCRRSQTSDEIPDEQVRKTKRSPLLHSTVQYRAWHSYEEAAVDGEPLTRRRHRLRVDSPSDMLKFLIIKYSIIVFCVDL